MFTCLKAVATSLCLCIIAGPVQERPVSPRTPETARRPGPKLVRLDGISLRKDATHIVMPQFPSSALAAGASGVCVAEVVISESGKTESVSILQSPSAQIAEEVKKALKQWAFKPVTVDGMANVPKATGKMAFYFVIRDGKGTVLTPEDLRSSPAASMAGGGHGQSLDVITQWDAAAKLHTDGTTLIDVRSRKAYSLQHDSRALNIPIDELSSRALSEIPQKSHVTVECSAGNVPSCEFAAHILERLGYKVAVMKD
jgi:TonB family protein